MVQKLLKDGRNEPVLALDGDITLFGERAKTEDGKEKDDGLEIIRNLIPQSKNHLNPMGIVLMETGEYNAEETSQIAQEHGFKTEIFTDLEIQPSGIPRSSPQRATDNFCVARGKICSVKISPIL